MVRTQCTVMAAVHAVALFAIGLTRLFWPTLPPFADCTCIGLNASVPRRFAFLSAV